MTLLSFDNRAPFRRGGESGSVAHDTTSASNWVVVGLAPLEAALIRAFEEVASVDALYAERDADGVLMVFVVTHEHTDEVYAATVVVEDSLTRLGHKGFELRVRAHQGRSPQQAVPLRALPLFLR